MASEDAVWRWYFCGKKRLAIYKMYGTITKPWRGESRLLLKERNLSDPYFWPMLDLGGRLTEERKYVLALLAVPKHRSKKHLWNRCNANCGKRNLKRLGMCHESKFSGKGGLFGWPIARPHSWPMFWPIRDYHTMDWADFIGFMTSGFSVKKREKPLKRQGKLDFLQLITRRS